MRSLITPQQLVAINLRYGTTAKALKPLAFADLSAKALFLSDQPLTTKEITIKVAEIINIKSVSEDLIKKGLNELNNSKKAFKKNGRWELRQPVREEIEQQIGSASEELSQILKRHFPQNIEEQDLSSWFTDAITDFFIYNGDEWVQSVCKGPQKYAKKVKTIDTLLDNSIKRHKLNVYSKELKNSFNCFLTSEEKEDQSYIASIGFAMFSARLVAADVGADPIALDELRNAIFLVDTNFLYALQLESHKLAPSLGALGKTLSMINSKLVLIHETKEEYSRVWMGRKSQIMKLFDLYPDEAIVKANEDDFILTAISRECMNEEDFESFFQSIEKPPQQMVSGPKIELLDYKEINGIAEKGKKDTKLKESILKWCLKLRPFWHPPKSASALNHDASLVYVTESERKKNPKFYILTLDKGFQACCAERVGSHDISLAIHLEGLIHILAANNAGPGLDATDFAPLLSNILIKRCIPPERMYSPQDLHWLYSIQKNIAKFRPEKIEQIALEVKKARWAGKQANDEGLQRTVNRFYQEEIQNADHIVEESIDRARKAEDDTKNEKIKRETAEKEVQELKDKDQLRKGKNKLIFQLIWRGLLSLLISFVVFIISLLILSKLQIEGVLDFIIAICTFIGFVCSFIRSPIKKYRELKNNLNKND